MHIMHIAGVVYRQRGGAARGGRRRGRGGRGGGGRRGGRAAQGVQGGRGVRAPARGHAAPRAPGQRTQVHGHLPAPAHLLQPLPRVHLVREDITLLN